MIERSGAPDWVSMRQSEIHSCSETTLQVWLKKWQRLWRDTLGFCATRPYGVFSLIFVFFLPLSGVFSSHICYWHFFPDVHTANAKKFGACVKLSVKQPQHPLEPQSKPLSFTCVSILSQSSLYDWGVNRVHGELACLGGVSKLHLVMGPAELLNLISQWQADRQPRWQVLTLKRQPFLLAPSLCLPIHTWRICDFWDTWNQRPSLQEMTERWLSEIGCSGSCHGLLWLGRGPITMRQG